MIAKKVAEFLNEAFIVDPQDYYKTEFTPDREDFVWNEVISELIKLMNATGKTFKYSWREGVLRISNEGGMQMVCRKKNDERSYGSSYKVSFEINNDPIISYRVLTAKFNEKTSFARVLSNGSYANYTISGGKIKGEWVACGLKNFLDLKLKKKCWEAEVKLGTYLKYDHDIQYFKLKDGDLEYDLTYKQVKELSKRIIKEIRAEFNWKAFIRSTDMKKFKSQLASRTLKDGLTIDNVVKFLEATTVKHTTTNQDRSGPWATTGTNEGIDEFDIAKLQRAYSENVSKFIMDNIEAIFKGLQKKKYSHPLGYYKLLGTSIHQDKLRLKRSCTTYYN